MTATIEIDCETYEDMQEQLSEIKRQLKKKKKDIWAENEPVIEFEGTDDFGNLHKVEIIVFDEFERDIDRLTNPSRYESPAVLQLNFNP
jgi:hypothetical protein